MTVTKLAISLPTELAEQARAAVRRGRAATVSAYVAQALEQKVTLDALADMLAEMLGESGGPLSATEVRAADEALGVVRLRRSTKVGGEAHGSPPRRRRARR
jgi:hypothetical protein